MMEEIALTRLDVAPDHWCHVTFIVHEASVEIRGFIGIRGHDVSFSTREWIFQEMKHGEEFSGGPALVRLLPNSKKRGWVT
jgi:hypothetical protein